MVKNNKSKYKLRHNYKNVYKKSVFASINPVNSVQTRNEVKRVIKRKNDKFLCELNF
jgi:hypothetical protein